jgi:hypothetical protein
MHELNPSFVGPYLRVKGLFHKQDWVDVLKLMKMSDYMVDLRLKGVKG